MSRTLGYGRNPGLASMTIIRVVEPVTIPTLSARKRRIRRFIKLLETPDLRAEKYPQLVRLMMQLSPDLEKILGENSLMEPCCVDGVSFDSQVTLVGKFNGLLPEVDVRHTDDDVMEAQVLNASGRGVRIERRKIGF